MGWHLVYFIFIAFLVEWGLGWTVRTGWTFGCGEGELGVAMRARTLGYAVGGDKGVWGLANNLTASHDLFARKNYKSKWIRNCRLHFIRL